VRIVCACMSFDEIHECGADAFVQCPGLFQEMRRKGKGKEGKSPRG